MWSLHTLQLLYQIGFPLPERLKDPQTYAFLGRHGLPFDQRKCTDYYSLLHQYNVCCTDYVTLIEVSVFDIQFKRDGIGVDFVRIYTKRYRHASAYFLVLPGRCKVRNTLNTLVSEFRRLLIRICAHVWAMGLWL